jgi:O-antigen/teichoic acid export membrane protein
LSSFNKNLARLLVLQALALLVPILLQLWLARALGPFSYGRSIFVGAVIAYFVLLCDFGFGWSATRLVAVHRTDPQRCSEVVSTTLAAKLTLLALGLALLALLVTLVAEFRKEALLLFAAYAGVLGAVLSPAWYFQGVERAHVPILADLAGRLLVAPAVVFCVTGPADLLLAIVLLAVGQLLGGAAAFVAMLRAPDLHWVAPSLRSVTRTLRQGAALFLSASAVSLYTATSGVVLGLLASREQVAYFGAAQKIVQAALNILIPFNTLLYPRASHVFQHEPARGGGFVRRAFFMQGAVGLLLAVALYLSADALTAATFGAEFAPAVICLKLMAPLPLLVAVTGSFANLIMLPLRRDALHLTMTAAAAAIHVAILIPLALSEGAVGASLALLASEGFVTIYALAVGGWLLRRAMRAAA